MIYNYSNHIKFFLAKKKKKCSENYLNELEKFSNSVVAATNISQIFGGIPAPTGKHYYASVLFTTLISRSVGFGMLLPYNSMGNIDAEYCDHGTAAIIARSIFEARLCFHYLCIDQCSDDEFDLRINLFNLHDCDRRIRIVDNDCEGFLEDYKLLKERIMANSFFSQFSSGRQSEILKLKNHFLYSLAEISNKAGIPEDTFKIIYPMMSAHVHCLPFSFYRTGQSNRGLGIYSEVEEGYLIIHMGICTKLLDDTINEYVSMWNLYSDIVLETKTKQAECAQHINKRRKKNKRRC